MKKLFITFALALALIGQNLQGAEKYKTLVVNATTTTATYNIPAGELCHVLYLFRASGLNATISGTTFSLGGGTIVNNHYGQFVWSGQYHNSSWREPRSLVIAGPGTITLSGGGDNFCTLRLIPTPNIGGVGQ